METLYKGTKINITARGGWVDVHVWSVGADEDSPGWYYFKSYESTVSIGTVYREVRDRGY